jgi:tetratricopeptide (TPR) repeat protein
MSGGTVNTITGMRTVCLLLFLAATWIASSQEGEKATTAGNSATLSIAELLALAESGDAAAQHKLAVAFRTGEGAPKDDAQAAKWALKASESYQKAAESETREMALREEKKNGATKAFGRASDFEKSYQWHLARAAYTESLTLDPERAEAKERIERINVVISALLVYEKNIEVAEQLAGKGEFQMAIRHFNEGQRFKPSYLENTSRVTQLRELLMDQNKPVEVAFKSDGRTWVSIKNFRAPAKLNGSIVLKMLPGDYQVLGRRRGFRDVNLTLQIRSGRNPPVITVQCAEATNTPPTASSDDAEATAYNRAYQIELAKTRAEVARNQAQFAKELSDLLPTPFPKINGDPEQLAKKEKFTRLFSAAQQLADKADFQSAIRFYNDAAATKPDLDYLEDNAAIWELEALLLAQTEPVEITIKSDGKTSVFVRGVTRPSREKATKLKIFPGDYIVVGTRDGYRTVNYLIQVRNGAPVPIVTVICEDPNSEKNER